MKNGHKVIGILLAGGVGKRMGANTPKQFLEVNGRPIIYYPLNIMERHPMIDAVEIVCVKDFIPEMKDISERYGFSKVKWITPGGETCQASTYNGLNNLRGKISREDIVLIHMSSYPLADEAIMTGCIESAEINGNGCTARPVLYSSYFTEDGRTSTRQIDRDKLMLCTVPYAFRFGECIDLYDRTFTEGKGINGNVFTNTLYCDYGKRIYFTGDSHANIKITSPEDLIIMRALLNERGRNEEISSRN